MAPAFRHWTGVLSTRFPCVRFPRLWALLRALLWLLIALPLWCLGLVVLVLGLALSPWGSGLLLEEGAKRGFYELAASDGAPLDRLVLHDFKLEAGPASVRLQRLELAWADDCLLRGQLCIERLAVEGARVRLGAGDAEGDADAPTAGEPPDEIRLPFPVSIRALSLVDVDLQLADGTSVTFEAFTTGAEAEASTLTLLPTRLGGLRVQLPLSAGVRLALSEAEYEGAQLTAEAIDAAIAVRSPLPAVAAAELQDLASRPLEERERLALPEIELPMRVRVPELIVEDAALAGPLDYAIRRLSLTLEARGQVVELTPLALTTRDTEARLTARVELRDDYPLEARLEAALWLPELMPELAGERLTLSLGGSLAELEVQLAARGPVQADLRARLDALDPTLPFTASLDSPLIQWPLPRRSSLEDDEDEETAETPSAAPYLAEDLSLRLEGSLLDYRASLSAQLEGPEIPRTRVALSGTGDHSHFAWTPLSLSLGRASIVSRGRADWADGLAVDAVLRLDNVDPSVATDAVQGRLDGDAEVAFALTPSGWRVEVPSLAIEGELQSLPLSLEASLAGNSEMRWAIDRLDFRQGENRVTASGRVSDTQLDLAGELELPALASLHEDASGRLSGQFATAGSLAAPELDLELSGDSLRFGDNRVASLSLDGAVSGLDDPELALTLVIERLEVGGQRFSEVKLGLDGRLSAHRLTLEALAGQGMPLSRASLALEGGLSGDRQDYSGRLEPLEVDSNYGDIRLDEPLAFEANLGDGSARVQPFCLRREQGGRLCLDETLTASAEQGRAALSLSDLPMAMLEEGLPEGWALSGESGLTLVAEWQQAGVRWRAQADLESAVTVQGRDAYGESWTLSDTQLDVAVEATQTRADVDLSLQLEEAGRVGLTLGIDDPLGQGRLDGTFTLAGLQLSRYRTLVTGMETLEGVLDGRVAIAGTRASPRLDGALELNGLQVNGAEVPVVVRDGQVRVELAGDRGRIQGFLVTDDGRLEIDGEADWPSPEEWRVAVNLDGTAQPLLVVLPEFGRLRVAPAIRVRIDPSQLQVRGEVQVPWARLEVGDAPEGAVTPSPDEVIITEREDARRREAARAAETAEEGADVTTAAALNEAGLAVDVRIDLRLGPDMELDAYGLNAGLRGNLEVRQQNGPVQLFGDVNLIDGRFRAFGQDLLIRQGQLLFSGPPDQPLLDFEAVRNPEITEDGVIAGLRVSGFAAKPSLSIFSEPAMDEARALSYLLRGRAPSDGDSSGALTSALIGLTVGQTGGAVGAIGEAFGIEDLALETAGAGDESQVVVSGYLTEDLRVSYGVGIFSPIAELTLRYTLWRNLYLQAVSGAAQAVDLVYTFSLPGSPPRID